MNTYLVAAAVAFACALHSGAADADILIATAGPMTGQFAPFGAQMKAGAEQAVADINAAGGVNGEKLVLTVVDDVCDAGKAEALANQMVGRGIVFMAGHLCSEASIAASQVYARQNIIQMSPATADPAFTEERPGPGIYRLHGRIDAQGKIAGRFLAENFAGKNVAIVHDKSAYGKGLADAARTAMNDAGKTAVLYDAYDAGHKDYALLVSRLKADGVDVLYVGGYHTEAALIKREMAERGMDTLLVSGDALVIDEFWSIAGSAGDGALMTLEPDPRANDSARPVVEALEAAGQPADGYAFYTYAAIQTFAQAAERAGSTDYKALVRELDKDDFSTVVGKFSFDENGDATLPAYIWYEWHDGVYDPA